MRLVVGWTALVWARCLALRTMWMGLENKKALAAPRKQASRWGDASQIGSLRSEGGWETWRGASRRAWEVIDASRASAYRLSHVLLASRDLAVEVADRAQRGEWPSIASLCEATKHSGGEIGWVDSASNATDGILPSKAKAELFSRGVLLRPGDVHLVSSLRGWHVIKVEDAFVEADPSIISKRKKREDQDELRLETYHIVTMGCQMNAADSERLEGALDGLGMRAGDPETADVVVLNTCSIRDHAERKVYAHLGPHAKRKRKTGSAPTIVVAGCVAQQEGRRLARRVPEVDVVMGPQYANRVAELLERAVVWGEQVVATEPAIVAEDEHLDVRPRRSSSVSAWVNVMYGCNERCTYCVVPATRGVQQSRTPAHILAELRDLQARGFSEATLLGQNVDAYGRDLPAPLLFSELLERAAVEAPPGFRLRFVTSHPRYMTRQLVEVVARRRDVVMPVFHVPAQSGDDGILRLMNRGYTAAKYLQVVETIRALLPDAAISSDFIVGCPGETEEAFERTLDLMRAVKFDACMTAAYSPRPNTPMAAYDGAVHAFDVLGIDVDRFRLRSPEVVARLAAEVEAAFKRLAPRAALDDARLADLLEARRRARRALDHLDENPLFSLDPLAQIGPSQVDEKTKEDRLRRINELATQHALERAQRHVGRLEPVLVEQRNTKRPDQVVGRTRTNKLVFFQGDIDDLRGRTVTVNITSALPFSLAGHHVPDVE